MIRRIDAGTPEGREALETLRARYAAGEHLEEGDWTFLGEMEDCDRVFPELELEWFRRVEFPPR